MTPFPKSFRLWALVLALTLCALASPAVYAGANLASGSAKGSLTFENATIALKYAAAFIDQKDERKPIILLLSDKKLPVEKWQTEFDMIFAQSKFNGIVFFLDKDGQVFRADVHMKEKQTGASGVFDLKLDNPTSKALKGSATATALEGRNDKLAVAFHATLK